MPRQRSNSSGPKSGSGSGRYSSTKSSGYTPFTRNNNRSNVSVVQPKAEKKPTVVPPAAPPPAAAPGRSTGDMMKDMATTAAGVAVGSAVGHAVGAGITGAFSGGGQKVAAEQASTDRRPHSELVEEGPCAFEIREFLKCSEENSDLNACKNFNEAMQRCRRHYNL